MLQFAYRDKIYIAGNIRQVISYLHELSRQYRTVREYLDQQMAKLQ